MRQSFAKLLAASVAVALIAVVILGLFVMATSGSGDPMASLPPVPEGMEEATFGSGCFWCSEAIFQQLRGVQSVVSGYTGGHVPNLTYRQVSSGQTGHAEAIRIVYDPREIRYTDL